MYRLSSLIIVKLNIQRCYAIWYQGCFTNYYFKSSCNTRIFLSKHMQTFAQMAKKTKTSQSINLKWFCLSSLTQSHLNENVWLYLGFRYRFSHCETNTLGERTVGCLRFLKNVANQAQSTKLSLLKSVHYLVVNSTKSTLQELLRMWLDRYVVLHKHIRVGVHLCERLRLRWCRGGALEWVWWRQICAAAQRTLGKRRHGPQVLHQEERTRGKNRNWSRESAWNLLTFGWRDESCREGGWHRLLLSGCINQMHRLQKANDVSLFFFQSTK